MSDAQTWAVAAVAIVFLICLFLPFIISVWRDGDRGYPYPPYHDRNFVSYRWTVESPQDANSSSSAGDSEPRDSTDDTTSRK